MANYQSTHTGEQIDEAVDKVLPLVSTAQQIDEAVDKVLPLVSTAEQIDEAVDKVSTQFHSNKNLLDNWYFGNPINQRGHTSYGQGYTVDRWYNTTGPSVNVDEGGGLTIYGIDATVVLVQYLEEQTFIGIKGKAVTISILYKNGTVESGAVNVPSSGGFDFTVGNVVGLISSTGARAGFKLICPYGGSISIVAVKLEVGTQQTLARQENGAWVLNEIPNYAEELLKCQRFSFLVPISASYCTIASGYAASATSARISIYTPTILRSTPSIQYLAGSISGFQIIQGGTNHSITGISTEVVGNTVFLVVTTTGLTTSNPVTLVGIKNNVQALLSADL